MQDGKCQSGSFGQENCTLGILGTPQKDYLDAMVVVIIVVVTVVVAQTLTVNNGHLGGGPIRSIACEPEISAPISSRGNVR